MKNNKSVIFFRNSAILIVLLIIFSIISLVPISCDDSGVIANNSKLTAGRIGLEQQGLKHLASFEGIYYLWLKQDSVDANSQHHTLWYNLGRFDISATGDIIDSNGNAMVFNYSGDTNYLPRSTDALITIETPGTFGPVIPGPVHLISVQFDHPHDSLGGIMKLSGRLALGSVGQTLGSRKTPINQRAWVKYTLQAPTSAIQSDCRKGLWFCDTGGTSYFPTGMQLNGSEGWYYEAWVTDTSNPSNPFYYSMGRFLDPYHRDFDSAGACRGPNGPGWDKPGQDWIQGNCPAGKPSIDFYNHVHGVMITLEPVFKPQGEYPFYLKLFWQASIVISCGQTDPYLTNQADNFPEVYIRIAL